MKIKTREALETELRRTKKHLKKSKEETELLEKRLSEIGGKYNAVKEDLFKLLQFTDSFRMLSCRYTELIEKFKKDFVVDITGNIHSRK